MRRTWPDLCLVADNVNSMFKYSLHVIRVSLLHLMSVRAPYVSVYHQY